MNKIKLIIDCDGVVLNTLQAMCDFYNCIYDENVIPSDIKTWDAKEVFVDYTTEQVEGIFKDPLFWNYAKPYDNVINMFKKLHNSDKFDMIFCSIGSSENLAYKTMWLKEYFPFIGKQILLAKNNGCYPDKTDVNMKNAIFIDDSQFNLFTSNAKYKVLCAFDGDKEWNKDWNLDDFRADTVDELYEIVMRIADKEFTERKIQETIDKCC